VQPDGVERGIVGEIISRFEKKGYRLVAMKYVWPSSDLASGHYADLAGRPFFNGLVKYFSSGKTACLILFLESKNKEEPILLLFSILFI
tara:strand:- start:79 stop:345 length:267 start_codon:yes stop_codon:yes gene_type:complete